MESLKKINTYLNQEIYLIFQMGKVASKSIENSINKSKKKCLHLHSFKKSIVRELFNEYQSKNYYCNNIKDLELLIKKQIILRLLKINKNINIITLVREPISRNLSFYFQDFQIPLMEISKNRDTTSAEKINIENFINDFHKNFNHEHGVNWFDNHFKKSFGIDIYKYPFNKEEGYQIIEKKNLNILVLKLEKLNKLENIIGQFIHETNFSLDNSNQGNKKWYGSIYNKFKKEIVFPEKFINELYSSKFMKHFYTDNEISVFKNKYLKTP